MWPQGDTATAGTVAGPEGNGGADTPCSFVSHLWSPARLPHWQNPSEARTWKLGDNNLLFLWSQKGALNPQLLKGKKYLGLLLGAWNSAACWE